MRDIKFRVFDNFRKKMVKQITSYHLDRDNNINLIVYIDKVNKTRPIFDIDKNFCNNFEIMQYTGLKDKNGVEIYEGDILAGVNGSVNGNGWNWGNYIVEYKNGNHNVPADWGSYDNYDNSHWFEVIGNIYENPELIEEENK